MEIWIFFSVVAGMFAHIRRNRNGVGWFFIALFFSPLVALVLLAVLRPISAVQHFLHTVNKVSPT